MTLGRIKKLSDDVISRIAAGEVVVSPSHALKELVENSLDAGSRLINIQLKKGGIQSLQISDDGFGIDKRDFPLLCERFTTSKLCTMKDIENLETFGFRGEALSSISYVSKLTVTSMIEGSKCGYKACFADGKIISEIEDIASSKRGTVIQFTDLFHNMPTRKRSLGSAAEEYSKCLELIQKYCIEFPSVAFSVRKHGNNATDLRTNGGDKTTKKNAIGIIYGSQLVKELINVNISNNTLREDNNNIESSLFTKIPDYDVELFFSGLNYDPKQNNLIIFVNGRLVKNDSIKQAIDVAYQYTRTKYWAYISIKVPSDTLDPNVHPTKNLVYIKHEMIISDSIQKKVVSLLKSLNYSRNMVLEKKPKFDVRDFSKKPDLDSNSYTKIITRVRTDCNQLSLQEYTKNSCSINSNIFSLNKSSDVIDSTQVISSKNEDNSSIYNTCQNLSIKSTTADDNKVKFMSKEFSLENINYSHKKAEYKVKEYSFECMNTENKYINSEHKIEKLPVEDTDMGCSSKYNKNSDNNLLNNNIYTLKESNKSNPCRENDIEDNTINGNDKPEDINCMSGEVNTKNSQVFRLLDVSKYVLTSHVLSWTLNSNSVKMDNEMSENLVRIKKKFITELEDGVCISIINNVDILNTITKSIINGIYIGDVSLNWSIIQANSKIMMIQINNLARISIKQSIFYRLGFIPLIRFNPPIEFEKLFIISKYMSDNVAREIFKNKTEKDEFVDFYECFMNNYYIYLKYIGIDVNLNNKTILTFPLCLGNLVPNFDYLPEFMDNVIFEFWNYHKLSNKNKIIVSSKTGCDLDFYNLFDSIVDLLVDYYVSQVKDNITLFQSIRGNSNLILQEDDLRNNTIELSSLEKLYKVFERC
ncbi:family ATpase [Cryptosporidium xiaoi]|uniref:Family ATpase n=1 Tax=Cryptosporidium xiaoi TaxID=659607 RepID=A0AAV9XYB9_9CRYT